mmetsp:Transcript_46827/g.100139  ORF Transcript_46827/g.100139 Transcript_46827/m.100139 type:complete len:145 (-) Transcript_46827:49-483(-)
MVAEAASSTGAKEEELTPQQVQQAYQQLEKECTMLINKVAELDQEVNEHALVLKAFEKVEPTRRCFRMVGGVLVERTVTEVAPAIVSNMEKIKEASVQFTEQVKKKTAQRNQFVEKYGLNQQRGQGVGVARDQKEREGGGSVLV